jgi:hypothetical protein
VERILRMAETKETLVGSVKAKVWAGVMSGIAAVAGSSTIYFWNTLTGQNAQKTEPAEKQRFSFKGKQFPQPQVQSAMFRPGRSRDQQGEYSPLLGCRVDEGVAGLRVIDVPPGSQAAQFGCLPGDVIESINKRPVQSALEIGMAAGGAGRLPASEMIVRRGEARLEADFRVRSDDTISVRTPLHPTTPTEAQAPKGKSKGPNGRR